VAREYATRHQNIREAISREFGDWLRLVPSAAGLHLTACAAPAVSIDLNQVLKRAEACGVCLRTVSHFSVGRREPDGLVIGYGAIGTASVEEGLQRLRRSFSPR